MREKDLHLYVPENEGQQFAQIYRYIPDVVTTNKQSVIRRQNSEWRDAMSAKLDDVLDKTCLSRSAQSYLLQQYHQLYVIGRKPFDHDDVSRPQKVFDVILGQIAQNPNALTIPTICESIDSFLLKDALTVFYDLDNRIKSGFEKGGDHDERTVQHSRIVNWIEDMNMHYSFLPGDETTSE